MALDTEILQTIAKMPESLKKEILHYAEYLLEKHAKTESSQAVGEQLHGYGSWAGQIVMSDENTSNTCLEYRPEISGEEKTKKRRSGILKGTFVLPLPDDFDEPLEDFKEYME